MSERRTFEERVTARLIRQPFTDAEGRKRLYKFFARAQPHVVRHYALSLPGWPRIGLRRRRWRMKHAMLKS